jgi:hypothetical protein
MDVLEVVEFTYRIEHPTAGFFGDIFGVVEHARNCGQRYPGSPGDFTHSVGHIVALPPQSGSGRSADSYNLLAGKTYHDLVRKATRLDKANPLG